MHVTGADFATVGVNALGLLARVIRVEARALEERHGKSPETFALGVVAQALEQMVSEARDTAAAFEAAGIEDGSTWGDA